MTETLKVRELQPVDICDKGNCGASAKAVILITGLKLIFCMHHTEELRFALEAQGAIIHTQYHF
jgi:hypothetical protein